MARSNYIYIVEESSAIVAAFTVKHELVRWLNRQPGNNFRVTRVRDASSDPRPTVMDVAELMEQA